MNNRVDSYFAGVLNEYVHGTDALIREGKHVELLTTIKATLNQMLSCFDETEQLIDEGRLLDQAVQLFLDISRQEVFRASPPGDNLLRLCALIRQTISSSENQPIGDRISKAHAELAALLALHRAGRMDEMLAMFKEVKDRTSGVMITGGTLVDIDKGLRALMPISPEMTNTVLAKGLIDICVACKGATGGISNPWTRRARDLVQGCGFEFATTMDAEDRLKLVSRSQAVMNAMRQSFIKGRPTDLSLLQQNARLLIALLAEHDVFRGIYVGRDLLGIAYYLIWNLEQRPALAMPPHPRAAVDAPVS